MDILTLAQSKTKLKKTASTHGGEWVGPCPSCGGRDRFHVWPEKTDSRRSDRVGIYWCRSCGKAGDVVQWLVDFEGMSYADAFRTLGEPMPENHSHKYAAPKLHKPPPTECTSNQPERHTDQSDLWLSKAAALVEHAEKLLSETAFAIKWLKKRGITKKTAAGMRIGWLSEDRFRQREAWGLPQQMKDNGQAKKLWIPGGLVIPMLDGTGAVRRIRIRRFGEQEPRYYVMPGSIMACMAHGFPNRAAVIVESELDAIMLAGIAGDLAAVLALGSSTAKPGADATKALAACAVVLVALDSDRAGAEAMRWWSDNFPNSRRWPVPAGKDPGEAFASGVDIRAWVTAGFPTAWGIGPSSFGLVSGRMAECEIVSKNEERAPVEESKAPITALEELAELLKRHPVKIRVSPDASRVIILESQDWKRRNWETSKRISELVFRDCAVLEHIMRHGAEIIDGKNIIQGYAEEAQSDGIEK